MIMPYLLHFKHSGAVKPANCNSVNRPVPLQSGHCMDPMPPQSLHVGIMCDLPAHMLCSNGGLFAVLSRIDCHCTWDSYFSLKRSFGNARDLCFASSQAVRAIYVRSSMALGTI